MPLKKLKNHDYIYERISPDGRLTGYQVKVRRKGYPPYTKTFDDLEEAKIAVAQATVDRSQGLRKSRLLAERETLGDVFRHEIKRLEEGKRDVKGKSEELYRLRAFLRRESALCATAMSVLDDNMMEDWIDQRLEEVKPGTVLRELRQIRPILRDAARRLHLPRSPLDYVENPSVQDERVARFVGDQEQCLFDEIAKEDDPWVLPAAEFALETGCRRSELLRIDWRDFDPKGGTVYLHDAKNGRGRHILLTLKAQAILEALPGRDEGGLIFKTDAEKLKRPYRRARKRAGMVHWRWHDFRHEAISRCFDDGWTTEAVMDFSGHVDRKSLERYRHADVDQRVNQLREMEAKRPERRRGLRVVA